MDEPEARLQLLLQELDSIQQGIRAFDAISFQVKGWCVTVAAAVVGASATTSESALVAIGAFTTLAFWMIDAHYKSVQRVYWQRDMELQLSLEGQPVLGSLASGIIRLPGLAGGFRFDGLPQQRFAHVRRELKLASYEFVQPLTFNLYAFVLLSLLIAFFIIRTLT